MIDEKDYKSTLVPLTGLWRRTTKAGESYMTAKVGMSYFSIFKNKNKNAEEHPDYFLYISPAMNKNKTEGETNG